MADDERPPGWRPGLLPWVALGVHPSLALALFLTGTFVLPAFHKHFLERGLVLPGPTALLCEHGHLCGLPLLPLVLIPVHLFALFRRSRLGVGLALAGALAVLALLIAAVAFPIPTWLANRD